jgi:hypothetical protein
MKKQIFRHICKGCCIILAAATIILAGCGGHKQADAASAPGGLSPDSTPAQRQQIIEQQGAAKAEYYKNHPLPGAVNH